MLKKIFFITLTLPISGLIQAENILSYLPEQSVIRRYCEAHTDNKNTYEIVQFLKKLMKNYHTHVLKKLKKIYHTHGINLHDICLKIRIKKDQISQFADYSSFSHMMPLQKELEELYKQKMEKELYILDCTNKIFGEYESVVATFKEIMKNFSTVDEQEKICFAEFLNTFIQNLSNNN